MTIDKEIEDELKVTVYLTPAPATSRFKSRRDGTEHQYVTRKALLVEYDTLLEKTLAAKGVDERDAEEIALLLASGAEYVSFYPVIEGKSYSYIYRKKGDYAAAGPDKEVSKGDNEAKSFRRALVRTITYERMKPDKDGRF